MAVKIRLSRIGKKKVPFFRIIAVDSRRKRDGVFLENLGTYDVLESKIIRIELDRIESWTSKGAIQTDSVRKLVRRYKAEQKGSEKAPTKTVTKIVTKRSEEVAKESSAKKPAPERKGAASKLTAGTKEAAIKVELSKKKEDPGTLEKTPKKQGGVGASDKKESSEEASKEAQEKAAK